MKKFKQKKCIAFTLMEMTLVLLITSIIAAASTPIVTSAVSDYADQNYKATGGEDQNVPWRVSSGYDGGGIYNTKPLTTSPIGMNVKFGSNASDYGYPTLAIETLNQNNLFNAPQITLINAHTEGYSTIGMDEFENIAIVNGADSFISSKSSSSKNTYIGEKSVFLGADIQTTAPYASTALDDMYYDNSVLVGQYINTRMTENGIYMGYGITRGVNERNVIAIGNNLGSESAYAATYQGNIIIGNYANQARVANNISIGNYAAYSSMFKHDINIGNFAGMGSAYNTTFIYSVGDSGNISMGQYAGALSGSRRAIGNGSYNVISIGAYAGRFDHLNNPSPSNNINIGDFAGLSQRNNTSLETSHSNVSIGYYAGTRTFESNEDATLTNGNVSIGYYAGYDTNENNRNVIIGSNIAKYLGAMSSVVIGNGDKSQDWQKTGYALGNGETYGALIIGSGAGANNSSIYGNVNIGYYAGNASSTNAGLYGNVGIGPWACAEVTGQNKWCLGWGDKVTIGAISLSDNTIIWDPGTVAPQMFIGYADQYTDSSSDWDNTAITLYASNVFRPSSTSFNTLRWSDKRLKTNISRVVGSLDKIRKVNIYDYTLKKDEHHTPRIGVLAQEFKKIFPTEVKQEPNSKKYAVGVDSLIYTMLDAMKDLDMNIQNLQKSFDAYVNDFMGLKSKVAKLEAQSKKLQTENAEMKSRLAKINAKLK